MDPESGVEEFATETGISSSTDTQQVPREANKANERNMLQNPDPPPKTSRKRRRSSSGISTREYNKKSRQLRGAYSDEYRQLFNSTLADAQDPLSSNRHGTLHTSQIGLTIWTSDEKHVFFAALTRYGRDDIPQIAAAVGKSQLEVRDYIMHLHDGFTEYNYLHYDELGDPVGAMQAAAEIGEECVGMLEGAAEALAWYQDTWEGKRERERWGEVWMLDGGVAVGIEEEIDTLRDEEDDDSDSDSESSDSATRPKSKSDLGYGPPDSNAGPATAPGAESSSSTKTLNPQKPPTPLLDAIPAASLLNLSTLLRLSSSVFMNSTDPDHQWTTYSPHPPSIRATALTDLATLIRSLTTRLVSATLFQAQSRLRATERLGRKWQHVPAVITRDVHTAIAILGEKEDAKAFWAGLPGRLEADWWFRLPGNRRRGVRVSRERARELLARPCTKRSFAEGVEEEDEDEFSAHEDDAELEEEEERGDESIDEATRESFFSSAHTAFTAHRLRSLPTLLEKEEAFDAYLEALDAQTSRAEERALWDVLGRDGPEGFDEEMASEEGEAGPMGIGKDIVGGKQKAKGKKPIRARRRSDDEGDVSDEVTASDESSAGPIRGGKKKSKARAQLPAPPPKSPRVSRRASVASRLATSTLVDEVGVHGGSEESSSDDYAPGSN
ncbi:hypothetical protein EJ06DRAFT_575529 [Trichodelitschia bisporula]|uniref:Myb-like domain-containing protein n=1 Tax=Trichodelitschia bisporula TaxID=703511 RepID=A0A6G1I186_9PEZI|nr:hypothetical protein EJ06DRAFT_575529 [Trichodelitschia bisporula]